MALALPNPYPNPKPKQESNRGKTETNEKTKPDGVEDSDKDENGRSRFKVELDGMGELREKALRNVTVGTLAIVSCFAVAAFVWHENNSSGRDTVVSNTDSDVVDDSSLERTPSIRPRPNVQPPAAPTVQVAPDVPASTEPKARKEPQGPSGVVLARQIRLQNQTNTVREAIEKLVAHVEAFHEQLQSLLSDELGRKVASSAPAVAEVLALGKAKRPTLKTVDGWEDEFDSLIQPLSDIETKSVEETDELEDAIHDFATRIEETSQRYEDDLDMLSAIVSSAENNSPATVTLREAIRDHKRSKASQSLKQLVKLTEAQAKEEQDRILAARKKLATAKALLEEEELKKQTIIQQQLMDKALRESDFQAAMPEIKRLLQPFITNGHFQPHPNRQDGEQTVEAGPMSLTRMQAMEMLDETDRGRQRLFGEAGFANDRPVGNFPKYVYIKNMHWDKYEITIKTAQRLLIKYADLMVEKGMLAP